MDADPNQPFYDPFNSGMPPNAAFGNQEYPQKLQRKPKSSPFSRIPSLFLPAIILLGFSWLLHAIATFIPYWSIYSGIDGSRAGLWSARNFNYFTIQNFLFPEANSYLNLTDSIRFTNPNTKAYLITVQFLMTFNFVVMLLVLVLLVVDYSYARQSVDEPRSFLIRDYNTSDTALKFGLLLYIIYVFVIFEFAAWITYVGSRHDNNWTMHVSFAFAVIVSIFLMVIFVMYVIEFMKRFEKNRLKWEYWYGRYTQWGFFVHLSALLLLLIVICCPEWAYAKSDASGEFIFAEIGLFKQCRLSIIFKKDSEINDFCTLSDTRTNQSWVNATQAFMLMAYIIGMIILIIIVVFRKEFRHDEKGYYSDRVSQPVFTYVIAGLILFFCFIFSLIGVSIFGARVFPRSIGVNWAYILAVFAMVLFLIAGILFILDAVHSQRQNDPKRTGANKLLFPAPLNQRIAAMRPLLKPERAWQPPPPPPPQMGQTMPPFFPPQGAMNYGMEQYTQAPLAQATFLNYLRQMEYNPQLSPAIYNQGLMGYSGGNPLTFASNQNLITNNNKFLTDLIRQQFLQQQRLNYNHERLLERYSRLTTPRASEFRTFGTSILPGRNYDQYLQSMQGDQYNGNSLVALSRAGIGTSGETYRWIGDGSFEPLPRGISSIMQHSRNDPMPFVLAEKFEPVKFYNHPIFGLTPAYIRPLYKKKKKRDSDDETEVIIKDGYKIHKRAPLGYVSYKNWKTRNEELIPVNPLLFTIYTQRSNGSIQSYGQSLYAPAGHRNRYRRLNHRENLWSPVPSDADSALTDMPLGISSASSHRYYKVRSHTTPMPISYQSFDPLSTVDNIELSDKESIRPNSPILNTTRNNSDLIINPPTSGITSTVSKLPAADRLSIKNISSMNNAGLSSPSSFNPPTTSTNPLVPFIPGSVSTSTVPYQTMSSVYKKPLPVSTATSSLNQNKSLVSSGGALSLSAVHDDVSSSSDSDDDEKTKRRKQKKKSAAANNNADVNSSSSDD